MREILFKGKRIDTGEWIEGYYRKTCGCSLIICDEGDDMYGVAVIPSTIGQYTGLTDKNGKKIFDGDVVEYEHELSGFLRFELGEDYKPRRSHSCHWDDKHYLHYKRNYIVEWKEKDARWILRNGSDQHDLRRISLSMHNGIVIGNIHDNPELLKGGEG
jgi:uncharacterized phage protein (TIGR01671 family)